MGTRFVALVEAGENLPTVVLVAKWRHLLGIDVNKLLEAVLDDSPRTPLHGFGWILQLAREKRGLEAADVARLAGCELAVYEQAEAGLALPTVRELARLRRVLRFNGSAALRAVWLADSQDSQDKGVA